MLIFEEICCVCFVKDVLVFLCVCFVFLVLKIVYGVGYDARVVVTARFVVRRLRRRGDVLVGVCDCVGFGDDDID